MTIITVNIPNISAGTVAQILGKRNDRAATDAAILDIGSREVSTRSATAFLWLFACDSGVVRQGAGFVGSAISARKSGFS
jgi:hypothetical protein